MIVLGDLWRKLTGSVVAMSILVIIAILAMIWSVYRIGTELGWVRRRPPTVVTQPEKQKLLPAPEAILAEEEEEVLPSVPAGKVPFYQLELTDTDPFSTKRELVEEFFPLPATELPGELPAGALPPPPEIELPPPPAKPPAVTIRLIQVFADERLAVVEYQETLEWVTEGDKIGEEIVKAIFWEGIELEGKLGVRVVRLPGMTFTPPAKREVRPA